MDTFSIVLAQLFLPWIKANEVAEKRPWLAIMMKIGVIVGVMLAMAFTLAGTVLIIDTLTLPLLAGLVITTMIIIGFVGGTFGWAPYVINNSAQWIKHTFIDKPTSSENLEDKDFRFGEVLEGPWLAADQLEDQGYVKLAFLMKMGMCFGAVAGVISVCAIAASGVGTFSLLIIFELIVIALAIGNFTAIVGGWAPYIATQMGINFQQWLREASLDKPTDSLNPESIPETQPNSMMGHLFTSWERANKLKGTNPRLAKIMKLGVAFGLIIAFGLIMVGILTSPPLTLPIILGILATGMVIAGFAGEGIGWLPYIFNRLLDEFFGKVPKSKNFFYPEMQDITFIKAFIRVDGSWLMASQLEHSGHPHMARSMKAGVIIGIMVGLTFVGLIAATSGVGALGLLAILEITTIAMVLAGTTAIIGGWLPYALMQSVSGINRKVAVAPLRDRLQSQSQIELQSLPSLMLVPHFSYLGKISKGEVIEENLAFQAQKLPSSFSLDL